MRIDYTGIMQALDVWADAGGHPRTPAEIEALGLTGHELDTALYLDAVRHDTATDVYHLVSRQLVGPPLGGDFRRHARISSDLMRTMRGNVDIPKRIERTCIVAGISPDMVDEFRAFVMEKLGTALVEIDNFAMAHYAKDGVRVGASVFQFDDED